MSNENHLQKTNIKDKELSVFGKTFFFIFPSLLLLAFYSCGKDKIERNPYLSSVNFNINLNLNLPQYDNLRYAGGGLSIRQGGINGLLVFNLNGNDFLAWEATCPNHVNKDCSQLSITGVWQSVLVKALSTVWPQANCSTPKKILRILIPCYFTT
jgi:hypothetical protein